MMKLDAKKLRKLAWARSTGFCEEAARLPEIKTKHLVSRYFDCLCEGRTTEQIEALLRKSEFQTYGASKDFTIHNIVGYFLKVFDSHIGAVSPNPDQLETKLTSARNEWQASKKAIEGMMRSWELSDKD